MYEGTSRSAYGILRNGNYKRWRTLTKLMLPLATSTLSSFAILIVGAKAMYHSMLQKRVQKKAAVKMAIAFAA